MFGTEKRLVALDVDVDLGVDELGDGVDAISAAGKFRRGELDGDVEVLAEVNDFVGVGRDEDVVELGAGAGGFDNPGEQGFAGDLAKNLARQASGGEAGWDDAEDVDGYSHRGLGVEQCVRGFTRFGVSRIIAKLCFGGLSDRCPSANRALRRPFLHRAV